MQGQYYPLNFHPPNICTLIPHQKSLFLCSLHSFCSSQGCFYCHRSSLCFIINVIFFFHYYIISNSIHIYDLNPHTLCCIFLLSFKANVMKEAPSVIIYTCSRHYHSLVHSNCPSSLRFQSVLLSSLTISCTYFLI